MQENLSPREQEILSLLVAGTSPKEIGYTLNISYDTVKFHQKNLYEKLGVNSLRELLGKYLPANAEDVKEKLVLKPLPCPFSIALNENPPWGWVYSFEPDVFSYNGEWHPSPFKLGKGNRLVEGDVWYITCFFTVNVDLDYLLVCFSDASIEEDYFYTELSGLYKLRNVSLKANTRYNLSTKILISQTASGATPLENKLNISVGGISSEPPLLTFHKFEVVKLSQPNILKSVMPAHRQLSQTELPVSYPIVITLVNNDLARTGGWIYRLCPEVFFYEGKRMSSPFKLGEGNRIVEDDVFLVNLFFTSSIDIDFIQIHLLDTTIVADNPWLMLSPFLTLKRNIKAGIENFITTRLLANETASGSSSAENQFILAVGPETKEPPTLTFTKLEVVKI